MDALFNIFGMSAQTVSSDVPPTFTTSPHKLISMHSPADLALQCPSPRGARSRPGIGDILPPEHGFADQHIARELE